MFGYIFRKIFGSKNERYIKRLQLQLASINALEEQMIALTDEELRNKIHEIKAKIQGEELDVDSALPEVYAIVRECSVRVLGMRHYDVQLVGGIVLHKGKIAEMKTGEGKTLVATLAVVLNALTGKGVHVVTVNDYLAKRDAQWMGKIYEALGLTVGVVIHGLSDEERKEAYGSDITYGTNNEFGFDYLRDNMKFKAEDLIQRGHNFGIVDEVDSILVDEARTPLIISGATGDSVGLYHKMDLVVRKLNKETDFTVDEKARMAILTEDGVTRCEELLKIENMFDPTNITAQHHILQSLKAHYIFRRDVDYMVKDDHVIIIDEFTGRPMPGRRFSDGLHQALEAKEGTNIAAENQTLASITFQNYFRLYTKLAGMTGTADTEAVEFQEIYGLEVVSIPPAKPMIRNDFPDMIYRTGKEKFDAIVQAIIELHESGQPVLVGTISIENSEIISNMLKKINIPHNVLNAKHHEQESEIIAQAGEKGRVTIATNMAGRGTDIVLGQGITDLGGLHILGTERHESRRIDNQLRGRSGRQGDPGSSRFYLSLEDDLMRRFGSDKISSLMQKLGLEDGESIENAMVTRAIEGAQKKVEGHHFEIRKTLLDYDNVMSQQREVIYTLRRELMLEKDLSQVINEFLEDILDNIYAVAYTSKNNMPQEMSDSIRKKLIEVFCIDKVLADTAPLPTLPEAKNCVLDILNQLNNDAPELYTDILRYFLLNELDRCWKEHLRNMDLLRDGIGLRGYGQKDPKLEYKREGFQLFQEMLFILRENVFKALTHVRIQREEEDSSVMEQELIHENNTGEMSYSESESEQKSNKKGHREPIKAEPKIGRNDLCPCKSGKKYKKCCGAK